jgi:hypothetical protein
MRVNGEPLTYLGRGVIDRWTENSISTVVAEEVSDGAGETWERGRGVDLLHSSRGSKSHESISKLLRAQFIHKGRCSSHWAAGQNLQSRNPRQHNHLDFASFARLTTSP